jgi:hypothetical protein
MRDKAAPIEGKPRVDVRRPLPVFVQQANGPFPGGAANLSPCCRDAAALMISGSLTLRRGFIPLRLTVLLLTKPKEALYDKCSNVDSFR